ncbi:MAG: vWA domain-containing protein [Akkermansiaceae bacterium]
MKHTLSLGLLFALSTQTPLFAEKTDQRRIVAEDPSPDGEKVQIALLLDTSGSMNGLIDQARTQLWKVVNTFVGAERNGVTPYVEVALYEYGKDTLHMGNNYIRQIQPFTRDLDQLSSDLFALTTSGGEEYCGAVIQRSLGDLKWDSSAQTYKAIFIAGNEPFTQGPVDARLACKDAVKKHIIVNTIHCGARNAGIAGAWHDGAALAEGKFMIIDQDRAIRHISAPQDKAISDLGMELNKTYIGYGRKRRASIAKQEAADHAAIANSESGSSVSRMVTKASKNYSNASWDLVDANKAKKIDLEKLDVEELPEEMKTLAPNERAAYVEKAARERANIQAQIVELNKQREAFVAEERKKQADGGAKTLDQVLIETTRNQATSLGYVFKN